MKVVNGGSAYERISCCFVSREISSPNSWEN